MLKKAYIYGRRYGKNLLMGICFLILSDLCGLTIPWLIRYPIDILKKGGSADRFSAYLNAIIVLAVIQGIFRYIWRRKLYGLSLTIEYELRNEYLSHLQTLPQKFYSKHKVGDIMSRATSDIKAIKEFFGLGAIVLVDGTLSLVLAVVLMFFIDIKVTFFSLIPLPIISLMVFFLKSEMRKRYRAINEKLSDITAHLRESVVGIRVIKAFVQEDNERNSFARCCKAYKDTTLHSAKLTSVFTPMMLFSIGLSFAISLLVGGNKVIEEKITLGAFVSFNSYLGILIWPMAAIGLLVNITQRAKASFDRLEEFMPSYSGNKVADKTSKSLQKENICNISIRNLRFCYPSLHKKNEASFCIKISKLNFKKGNLHFIVGKIGSGKSTLIKILSGFMENYSGVVKADGMDIKNLGEKYKNNIGYVDEEPFLFSGPIGQNITFGLYDKDDKELLRAAETANISEDILNLPQRFDTLIGEKGVMLSGGQKQRVAIARALFKKPSILLFDNSFTHLDIHTEKRIIDKLRKNFIDSIIIIASHRLNIIQDADIAVVIKEGEVIELGTHKELFKKKKYYHALYSLHAYGLEE